MADRVGSRLRLMVAGCVGILAVAAAVGWWQRTPITAWYTLRQLHSADDAGRPGWVQRAAALGEAVRPTALAWLADPASVDPARAVLAAQSTALPPGDAGRQRMVRELATVFAGSCPAGQEAAVELAATLTEGDAAAGVAARPLVSAAVGSTSAGVRAAAVRLAGRPEVALSESLVPLLHDPEPAVRREALLALASARELLSDEELLHWLHDTDAEARKLCETALRGRGLRQKDVDLGRRLTDPEPLIRLGVLEALAADDELDPKVWLAHLRADPAPAVRAAVARAPEYLGVDFRAELTEMAGTDPDPAVRRLAAYQLRRSPSEAP
jgi:HEAT repeat protein